MRFEYVITVAKKVFKSNYSYCLRLLTQRKIYILKSWLILVYIIRVTLQNYDEFMS